MQKIKPISPSLREKKRYLAAEIIAENNLDFKDIKRMIKESYATLFGTTGVAKAGILFLKDTTINPQRLLIRINNKELNNLRSSLAFVKEIMGKKAIIRSAGVSGTLKKAREKYMRG